MVYAPPFLYLVHYDKSKHKLRLKRCIVVGFIPYTVPEVHFNEKEGRSYAYIVGGDTPAESILFSIALSSLAKNDVNESLEGVEEMEYCLNVEQKMLTCYVENIVQKALQLKEGLDEGAVIDLYALLGTRRSIAIDNDTKVVRIPLSDFEVKRVLMKQYGRSIAVIVIPGKERPLIQVCIVKPKRLATDSTKSYINTKFCERVEEILTKELNIEDKECSLALRSLLYSLKVVLESKYGVNVSCEELKELVYDIINDKESIEFDTVSFDILRRIAKYMRVIRGEHSVYDVFEAYEKEY